MERPKLMRNPTTKKYLLWFHCDTDGFAMRSVGVLTADAVTGPFKFVTPCFRPDGQDSYDMGTFYDDPALGGDGHAYLIRSVGNKYAGISQLTADWTGTTPAGIVSAGPDMEGQALMRDVNGTLHAAGSHLTGWASNAAQFVTSPNASLVGAHLREADLTRLYTRSVSLPSGAFLYGGPCCAPAVARGQPDFSDLSFAPDPAGCAADW
jgi:hypothetical protein